MLNRDVGLPADWHAIDEGLGEDVATGDADLVLEAACPFDGTRPQPRVNPTSSTVRLANRNQRPEGAPRIDSKLAKTLIAC